MRLRISIRGSVRPYVRPSVRPSVCPSVRMSVRNAFSKIVIYLSETHLLVNYWPCLYRDGKNFSMNGLILDVFAVGIHYSLQAMGHWLM